MARVTFIRDYDYRLPGKSSTIAYKGGRSYSVPKAHEAAARAAGALEEAGASTENGTDDGGSGSAD